MKNDYLFRLNEFVLRDSDFTHPSYLHGLMHTYRVMAWTQVVAKLSGSEKGRNAFFAAMVHDMGRVNDKVDPSHGEKSAKIKFPIYKELFKEFGASLIDLNEIEEAISMHSLYEENDNETLKILKDADALDRVRLHPSKPDPGSLRFPFTLNLVPKAAELLIFTEGKSNLSPEDIIRKAADLAGVDLF